jgi:hypothetical protein
MYTIPQTPLEARVWYLVQALPPPPFEDEILLISLSPLAPAQAFSIGLEDTYQATHIIRSASSERWCDNYDPGNPGVLFPATVIECPIGSGHLYVTVWAHICGPGFPNEHVRAYMLRVPNNRVGGVPLFEGYI